MTCSPRTREAAASSVVVTMQGQSGQPLTRAHMGMPGSSGSAPPCGPPAPPAGSSVLAGPVAEGSSALAGPSASDAAARFPALAISASGASAAGADGAVALPPGDAPAPPPACCTCAPRSSRCSACSAHASRSCPLSSSGPGIVQARRLDVSVGPRHRPGLRAAACTSTPSTAATETAPLTHLPRPCASQQRPLPAELYPARAAPPAAAAAAPRRRAA